MHDRSGKLKRYVHALCDAGVRRTAFFKLVGESLRQTQGESVPMRRAKALAHLLDNVDQVVLPYELVAGSILGRWPLAEQQPEGEGSLEEARRVVAEHLHNRDEEAAHRVVSRWALMDRDHYDSSIPFDELQNISRQVYEEVSEEHDVPFAEVYRVLELYFTFHYGEDRRLTDRLWFSSNHLHLNYKRPLQWGLGGLRDRIIEKRDSAPEEKREFYETTLIAVEACIRFIERYTETLDAEADRLEAKDPERARELRGMAEVSRRVAEDAPQTFREAIQLVWYVHIISNIAGGSAMSFARFDQYMFPFYRRDVQEGRITRDQAKELIESIWLKVNEPKMRTVQSICLGGVTPEGEDGTNELTYVCLEVAGEAGEPYPNTHLRLHKGAPEDLWDKAVETLLKGVGHPALWNDESMVTGMVRQGIPPEDARQYYPMGCIEVMLEGMQPTYQGGTGLMFAGTLELVFKNGGPNYAGQTGLETGELSSFETFEDFLEAYLAQIRHHISSGIRGTEESFFDRGERYDPLASALIEGSLESGVDPCQGGAKYDRLFCNNGQGFGTAVDSLVAVKRFVYDEGELTLEEMKELLDEDFAGHEALRQRLSNRAPTFGNDIDEVDEIAVKVFDAFADTSIEYDSQIGATYFPQMFSYHSHVWRGEITDATPNGRPRGATYSDGMGPSQGKDALGPTALINSVTRLDHTKLTGGAAFNIKLEPGFVGGPEGRRVFKTLLKTYQERGGMQIQVNLVDQKTLEHAQEHPEEHRNLIVRVAGFCEYFTSLDRKVQDEIIQRTAQEQATR